MPVPDDEVNSQPNVLLPRKADGNVRLGICLYDLDRIEPFIFGCLLRDKLSADPKACVLVEQNRPDETAVPFVCDLLTAALACDVVRDHDRKVGQHPTRVYVLRKAWSRLPGDVVLTLVRDGKAVLNPRVFADAALVVTASPPPPRRVELGGRSVGRG